MKITQLCQVALVSLALLAAGVANATVYNLNGLMAGPLINPSTFTATVSSAAADSNASLNFVVTGFNTLDGHNTYEDVLTLIINGTQTFTGSFNLGGGGSSDHSFGSGTAVTSNPDWVVGRQGGTTTVTGLNFSLLSGVNTFQFAYSAPGPDNGSGQSLADEGWGIASASVTAVPEPETYAMFLAGLGLIGFMARRRSDNQA